MVKVESKPGLWARLWGRPAQGPSVRPLHITVPRLHVPATAKFQVSTDNWFSWQGQKPFEERVRLIQHFLSGVCRREVELEVVRYRGAATNVPLVLTMSPRDSSYFHMFYCVCAEDFLKSFGTYATDSLSFISQSFFPTDSHALKLDDWALAAWGRLGGETGSAKKVTLWELPVNLTTHIHEESTGLLCNVPYQEVKQLITDAGYYPGDLLSMIVMLSGEPHLMRQFQQRGAPVIGLPSSSLEFGGCLSWRSTPMRNDADFYLSQTPREIIMNFGFLTFQP